ncbi:MAG: hypothetical protein LLG06_12135 [Desulfobacteraceae bacterium]|nr:hypothetical protein [Desulfobacteraceae bacterium]
MPEGYPINIWVNEERFARLDGAGLLDMARECVAGLKVIVVYANDAQRDKLLKIYPGAKFDSATTKSIELLPRKVKDEIFDLVLKNKNVDVLDEFLKDR